MEQPIITKSFNQKKFQFLGFRIIDLAYGFVSIMLAITVGLSVFPGIVWKIIGTIIIMIVLLMGLIPIGSEPLYTIIRKCLWKWSSKNQFHTKDQIATLIPIYKAEHNYLINDNGVKTCAFKVNGIDLSIMDESEVEMKLKLYEQLLKTIEIEMYLVKVDEKVTLKAFKSWLNQQIKTGADKLKKQQLKDYQNQIKAKEKEFDLQFYLIFANHDEQKLINVEKNLKNFLAKIQITCHRLTILEHINLLKSMYFGLNKPDFTAHDLKNNDETLDLLLSYEQLTIKNKYIIAKDNDNTTYVSFKSIKEYALHPSLNWFFAIALTKGTVIAQISQLKASAVNKKVNNANIKAKVNQKLNNKIKLTDVIEEETDIDSINELAVNLKLGNEKLFMLATTFINFGADLNDLKANENNLKMQLDNQDFKLSHQTFKQLATFTNSFPTFNSSLNPILAQEISSWALATGFPFIDNRWIDTSGVYLGDTNSYAPFILDFFKRKSNVLSGNAIIIGSSGSGKTLMIKKIVNSNVVNGIKTIIFDPERTEFLPLIKQWNGQIINVALGNKTKINPLAILTNLDSQNLKIEALISNHLQILEEWILNLFPTLNEFIVEAFLMAVQNCYQNAKFYRKSYQDWKNEDFPIFDDLKPYILAQTKKSQALIRLEYLINNFIGSGKYANLWNGYTNIDLTSDLILFDFADFGSGNQNTKVKAAQLSLLIKITDNIVWNNDLTVKKPIQIIVDEAHTFINDENSYALNMMTTFARRIRKRNGSFLLGTQNISDFVKLGAIKDARAIINNCQFSFIGKLMPQDLKDLDQLYSEYNGFTHNEKISIRTQETNNFLFINGGIEKIFFTTKLSACEKQNMGWVNKK